MRKMNDIFLKTLKNRGGYLINVKEYTLALLLIVVVAACSNDDPTSDFSAADDTRSAAADSTAAGGDTVSLQADTAWADTLRLNYDVPSPVDSLNIDGLAPTDEGDAAEAAARRGGVEEQRE